MQQLSPKEFLAIDTTSASAADLLRPSPGNIDDDYRERGGRMTSSWPLQVYVADFHRV